MLETLKRQKQNILAQMLSVSTTGGHSQIKVSNPTAAVDVLRDPRRM